MRSLPRVLSAGLVAAVLALGCAPNAALVHRPLALHMAETDVGAEGVQRLPSWCEADGVCHVGGSALLDERDVESVGLQRGDSRVTLQLRLNRQGLDKLAVVSSGAGAGGRLTLVVDRKALQASSVEQARRDGHVVVTGPAADMERLFHRLTARPADAPAP